MIQVLLLIAAAAFFWLYWHLRKKTTAQSDEDINLPMIISEQENLPAIRDDVWPPLS